MTQADPWKLRLTPSFREFLGATHIVVRQHDVTHGTPSDSEVPRVSLSFLGRLKETHATQGFHEYRGATQGIPT